MQNSLIQELIPETPEHFLSPPDNAEISSGPYCPCHSLVGFKSNSTKLEVVRDVLDMAFLIQAALYWNWTTVLVGYIKLLLNQKIYFQNRWRAPRIAWSVERNGTFPNSPKLSWFISFALIVSPLHILYVFDLTSWVNPAILA